MNDSGKIYLEPEELKAICDEILGALDTAEVARQNLKYAYKTALDGMNSDFIDKLEKSMDICDINADENSITILTNQMNNIKESSDLMLEIDKELIGE